MEIKPYKIIQRGLSERIFLFSSPLCSQLIQTLEQQKEKHMPYQGYSDGFYLMKQNQMGNKFITQILLDYSPYSTK